MGMQRRSDVPRKNHNQTGSGPWNVDFRYPFIHKLAEYSVMPIDILLIRCEFVLQRTHGGDSAVESSAAWLE